MFELTGLFRAFIEVMENSVCKADTFIFKCNKAVSCVSHKMPLTSEPFSCYISTKKMPLTLSSLFVWSWQVLNQVPAGKRHLWHCKTLCFAVVVETFVEGQSLLFICSCKMNSPLKNEYWYHLFITAISIFSVNRDLNLICSSHKANAWLQKILNTVHI